MEIFIDGGLFEILLAITLGYTVNFVFAKKYLLIVFSVISIVAPALLFFLHQGEWFYFLLVICMFNSALLVILLWKMKEQNGEEPLFDIGAAKKLLRQLLSGKSHWSRKQTMDVKTKT
jgi:hypothetical protein